LLIVTDSHMYASATVGMCTFLNSLYSITPFVSLIPSK